MTTRPRNIIIKIRRHLSSMLIRAANRLYPITSTVDIIESLRNYPDEFFYTFSGERADLRERGLTLETREYFLGNIYLRHPGFLLDQKSAFGSIHNIKINTETGEATIDHFEVYRIRREADFAETILRHLINELHQHHNVRTVVFDERHSRPEHGLLFARIKAIPDDERPGVWRLDIVGDQNGAQAE